MSVAVGAMLSAAYADAQDYPQKPVRLVIGFPPGGSNDIIARQISPKLSEILNTNFIVENRPGANAILGTDYVAKAAPDGYTLGLAGLSPLVIAAFTYAKIPYDSVNDFAGITTVVMNPLLIVVHPALPARSMKEFIALAKAQPNKLDFATAGAGGSTRMLIELMKLDTGIKIQAVAYKGAGPALTELLGGHVQGMVMDLPVLLSPVKNGRLRALAVTSEKRSALLPDVATVAEQGLPALQAVNWYAILAPAKPPRAIVDKLQAVHMRDVGVADVLARLHGDVRAGQHAVHVNGGAGRSHLIEMLTYGLCIGGEFVELGEALVPKAHGSSPYRGSTVQDEKVKVNQLTRSFPRRREPITCLRGRLRHGFPPSRE